MNHPKPYATPNKQSFEDVSHDNYENSVAKAAKQCSYLRTEPGLRIERPDREASK